MFSLRINKIRIIVLIIYSSLISFSSSAWCNQEVQREAISLTWAFAAKVKNDNVQKIIPVTHKIVLRSGDKVKMFIGVKEKCYVYVIYHSSSDKMDLLFPSRLAMLNNPSQLIGSHYLPARDRWFELDNNTGIETFHLIASTVRLVELEEMLKVYTTVKGNMKRRIRRKITSIIDKIVRPSQKLTVEAEKPTLISGSLRKGNKAGIDALVGIRQQVIEIDTDKSFIKTYKINHKSY